MSLGSIISNWISASNEGRESNKCPSKNPCCRGAIFLTVQDIAPLQGASSHTARL